MSWRLRVRGSTASQNVLPDWIRSVETRMALMQGQVGGTSGNWADRGESLDNGTFSFEEASEDDDPDEDYDLGDNSLDDLDSEYDDGLDTQFLHWDLDDFDRAIDYDKEDSWSYPWQQDDVDIDDDNEDDDVIDEDTGVIIEPGVADLDDPYIGGKDDPGDCRLKVQFINNCGDDVYCPDCVACWSYWKKWGLVSGNPPTCTNVAGEAVIGMFPGDPGFMYPWRRAMAEEAAAAAAASETAD